LLVLRLHLFFKNSLELISYTKPTFKFQFWKIDENHNGLKKSLTLGVVMKGLVEIKTN
jgi:hypothetical protein